MFKIQTLNKISARGLDKFPRDDYEIASSIQDPDAILVRSQDMHNMEIKETVKAVARAGAGTNNIPIKELTGKGIVVFNTPGANANAVKELVILSLLLSSRPVFQATKWINGLAGKGDEIEELTEKGKSQFIGNEIMGKRLGVIGLGVIGAMVANSAVELGMEVIGFDPFMSVDSAWRLNQNVKHAETLDTLLSKADYITLHVPQTDDTKGLICANTLKAMKDGVKIINIARGGLVNNADMLEALKSGKVSCFVTDFASEDILNNDKIICMPHLGASTPEAEENCALMAVKELRDFLENGNITNSVNFPKCVSENPIPGGGTRLCISHINAPAMVAKFTTILGDANLNIAGLINQNKGELAYNIIDVDGTVPEETLRALATIENVTKVRPIFAKK
ncbi:3-phosphoglycerate dehydrogenase [Treponema parvum]|uniref:3-phosphoglycerate dehydrogenase n=1 Tax=Treponema parvum TaxID=138851 RepID=A0A975F1P4_9SPIR|nr:3-phosphoglycerate dehydrogenase family protein [Treponema parvum]QTQ12742.1 3-phosphoglycerate dehydrogenase [Treponema parvum]QTQ15282.1 3-phosphoglycerate dehydrogenase [Treponema parvum]